MIPGRYRTAIVSAARAVFELLLDGYVTAADWNAILKTTYPQWCDEPGLARASHGPAAQPRPPGRAVPAPLSPLPRPARLLNPGQLARPADSSG